MSEAALQALSQRAKGAEPAPLSARAQALADISARAEGKTVTTPVPPKPRKTTGMPGLRTVDASKTPDMSLDRAAGRGETALQMGTGAAGSVVGGITGLGTVLAGQGADEAAEHVNWWQQALTYQPRTAEGAASSEALGHAMESGYNPLTWPGRYGEEMADAGEELGLPPGVLTALRMAPEASTAFLSAPGRVPAAARASVVEDVQAARAGVPKALEKVADLEEPPVVDVNPFERESMGAAAAVPSQLKSASPELQAEVRKAARTGGVDRDAFERQLRADSLGLPPLTEGQATRDVSLISNELNRRGKDKAFADRFNKQNQAIIDKLDEFRQEAAPNVVGNDPVQSGQALIDLYKTHDEAVVADIGAKYKALRDANGGDFPVDGIAFVDAADAALKKNMKGRYVPAQIEADLAEFRDGGPMTFEQFENLRTNLAAEGRKADRSGDGNAARAVSIVRDALESLPGVPQELKGLADTARSAAKARHDRLRADPAYRAAADDSVAVGEASPLADTFVQQFVVKGKAANLKTMRDTLGNSADANELMAAGAMNYLKSKSGVDMYTNEGNFSQAGFNRALSELNPKLNTLVGPDGAEKLQALGEYARDTQFQPRGSFANNSNTFVAAAAEKAKSAAEGVANNAALGLPVGTWARQKIEARSSAKETERALRPGAGIEMKPKGERK